MGMAIKNILEKVYILSPLLCNSFRITGSRESGLNSLLPDQSFILVEVEPSRERGSVCRSEERQTLPRAGGRETNTDLVLKRRRKHEANLSAHPS